MGIGAREALQGIFVRHVPSHPLTSPEPSPLVQIDAGLLEQRIGRAPQGANDGADAARLDQPLSATGRVRPGARAGAVLCFGVAASSITCPAAAPFMRRVAVRKNRQKPL
jgi:hypothetical protein